MKVASWGLSRSADWLALRRTLMHGVARESERLLKGRRIKGGRVVRWFTKEKWESFFFFTT